jgi:hypothetical protein
MLWSLEHATAAMQFYRDFITQAPDDINGFFAAPFTRPQK